MNLLGAQLNQHLRRLHSLLEDPVVITDLQETNGSAVAMADNKLVLFLGRIERDAIAHRAQTNTSGAASLKTTEPLFLNLLVVCAANFGGKSYAEGLKLLSSALAHFQEKSVLDRHNTPELDDRIGRLVLSIENLDANQMQNLWSIHGGRYLPSVLYRISLLGIDGDAVTGRQSPVRAITATATQGHSE